MPNDKDTPVPDVLYDPDTKTSYQRGRYFGRGGFAKCYEIINTSNQLSYAGKIISKKVVANKDTKGKMTQEINVHASLQHQNVVGFHTFFEDQLNIYIVLELCNRRSMMELHKRRKVLTEPETRFYVTQIISGVQYLHHQKVIHRDLKLGNLFLTDELHVKIGDFGLACKLNYDGERKKTLCGTPNYIAPEILNKNGHSYEVDIWSIGCIMYTLLVGRPPFETTSLKETYAKIRRCDYKIIPALSTDAKTMIMKTLQAEPAKRPNISQLSKFNFLTKGLCPTSLPVSSLTLTPRFDAPFPSRRGPLLDVPASNTNTVSPIRSKHNSIAVGLAVDTHLNHGYFDAKRNLMDVKILLKTIVKCKPLLLVNVPEDMTDPAAQPTVWISKWVDYSDKYGFGYQLSDDSVGVMFNDTTRIIMLANGLNVQYVDKDGKETYMTVDDYPKEYDKKMKLLSYFTKYMKENLAKTGAEAVKQNDTMTRTVHLHQWCRSKSGVLMQLNSGILQMNFVDHTKLIICPTMEAVTYVQQGQTFKTVTFNRIRQQGCVEHLHDKLIYAYTKITVLLEVESNK